MRLCIVTLLLVSVGLALTEDKSNRPVTFCQNPVPGVVQMTGGIDITSFDLFATKKSRDRFRQNVFDLTCNKGKKFHHGTLNKDFDLPDQVVQINTPPYGYQKITSNFTTNVYQMNMAFSNQAKITGGLFLHQVTNSRRYNWQIEAMLQNKYIFENFVFVDSIEIDFGTKFSTRPSKDLMEYLNHLPATYEEDPELYRELVGTFGTHYIESGALGGMYKKRTLIDQEYLKKTSILEIKEICQKGFPYWSDAKAKAEFEADPKYDGFRKHSQVSLEYFGGFASLNGFENAEQFRQWEKSVAAKPGLLTVRLVPITAIIKNHTLSLQIKRVVDAKLNKAMCERAKTNLEFLQEAHPKLHQIDKLIEEANECIDKDMPNKGEAEDLRKASEKLLNENEIQQK